MTPHPRPPPLPGHRVGVDLGGTKTEAVLLDDKLAVLKRRRVPTPRHRGRDDAAGYGAIIATISRLVSDVAEGVDDFTVGVCTPGVASGDAGVLENSNTQCLIGRPLKRDLQRRLDREVLMDNDANCFAMAEARMGSVASFFAAAGAGGGAGAAATEAAGTGKAVEGPRVVFGVIMGTGVGGGVVIDGRVYRGRTGIGGEWGHHVLHHNGNPCYCGGSGCVETYISGPALERRWRELTGRTETVPEIVGGGSAAAPGAWHAWKGELVENFGRGLANVIDILDPSAVVLGGGLSNIDFLYTDGRESVYSKVFSDRADTPILRNGLGDSAGVIGACLLRD